jgi:hypothetical protein
MLLSELEQLEHQVKVMQVEMVKTATQMFQVVVAVQLALVLQGVDQQQDQVALLPLLILLGLRQLLLEFQVRMQAVVVEVRTIQQVAVHQVVEVAVLEM